MPSITYAGTTIAVINALPATNDQAGFEALTPWEEGECALQQVPSIMREWQKVQETLVCADTNTEIKGSAKWNAVAFPMSVKENDAAQLIYEALEASRNDVGSFRLKFPGVTGAQATIYFTAQVSKYALVDGGGQDDIVTRSAELLIQTTPVKVVA